MTCVEGNATEKSKTAFQICTLAVWPRSSETARAPVVFKQKEEPASSAYVNRIRYLVRIVGVPLSRHQLARVLARGDSFFCGNEKGALS